MCKSWILMLAIFVIIILVIVLYYHLSGINDSFWNYSKGTMMQLIASSPNNPNYPKSGWIKPITNYPTITRIIKPF